MMNYSHAIPIKHNLKSGALWEYKHTLDELEVIKKSDPYVYAAQYAQVPAPQGGAIFKDEWWRFYTECPPFDYRIITADTGQKTKEINDFSVFQLWGWFGHKIYLIDQIRGKWEAPELLTNARAFWNSNKNKQVGTLRAFYIEDKVSGTGLIQQLKRDKIPIVAIPRIKDKITRYMDCVTFLATHLVNLPQNVDWLSDYLDEFRKITPLMNYKHDDQVDTTADAIDIMLIKEPIIKNELYITEGIAAEYGNELFV